MTRNSNTGAAADKASLLQSARDYKQREQIPLLVHTTLRWARKINGKLEYFGPVKPKAADFGAAAALAEFHRTAHDLNEGRRPQPKVEGVTVADVANHFLNWKRELVEAGELRPRTLDDYERTASAVVAKFGKQRAAADLRQDDFAALRRALAKTREAVALSNEIQRVRSIFKFGYDAGLMDAPLRYGPKFKRPQAKTIRENRHAAGLKMFEADEIRAILDAAGVQMRAMILLAINGGMGNADAALLPLDALNQLAAGWLDYPRPKTAVPRRIPLWPETVAAVQTWLEQRKPPRDPAAAGLVFVTKYGKSWHKDKPGNPISSEFAKLLDAIDEAAAVAAADNGSDPPPKLRRRGRGFYALRHSFETIGGEALDQIAVDAIMGHVDPSMAARYRERISDQRLRAVTDCIHAWLFPPAEEDEERPAAADRVEAGFPRLAKSG